MSLFLGANIGVLEMAIQRTTSLLEGLWWPSRLFVPLLIDTTKQPRLLSNYRTRTKVSSHCESSDLLEGERSNHYYGFYI